MPGSRVQRPRDTHMLVRLCFDILLTPHVHAGDTQR